jgi:hypothetical protein
MAKASMTQTHDDFGHPLWDLLAYLASKRGFQWPILLAVLDQQHQRLLQTVQDDDRGGVVVHYPPVVGYLGAALCPPMHLLLVDRHGHAIKATVMETGRWILG